MKIKEGEYLLQDFIDKAEKDKDPYFVVHFSRKDDYFMGYHERMDEGDALIVVKNLIEIFNLSPDVIALMDFKTQ